MKEQVVGAPVCSVKYVPGSVKSTAYKSSQVTYMDSSITEIEIDPS